MNNISQKYIDSREVAEMVGREHNKLMRDIRIYIEQLGASKIGHTDFSKNPHIEQVRIKNNPVIWLRRRDVSLSPTS